MRAFWAISRLAFYGLLVMLVVGMGTFFLPLGNRDDPPAVACYWRDRGLVDGAACQGFPGSRAAGYILSMPALGPFWTLKVLVFGGGSSLVSLLARAEPFALAVRIGSIAWLVMGLLYPLRLEYLRLRAKPS